MSIGVERVNGGIIGGQWTEGYLVFLKIDTDEDAFVGSYAESTTEKGFIAAPKSAAEEVYKYLAQFGTPVIFEIVNTDEIHVALAYGARRDAGFAAALQTGIRALGAAFPVKRFDGGAGVQATSDDLVDATADFASTDVTLVTKFELA